MSLPDDLQPNQLLHYLPDHQVLVCTSCHYAIQPRAISRHLKEIHHLYRSRRRAFLRHVADLTLKDPQDVIPPKAHQFPVAGLPVEHGLKCDADGCQYLCVSLKRMQNHWIAEHDRKGAPGVDWSPAPLQTFFRGNLLRYITRDRRDEKNGIEAAKERGGCPRAMVMCDVPQNSNQSQHASHPNSLSGGSAGGMHEWRGLDSMDSIILKTFARGLDSMDSFIFENYFFSTYQTFVTNDETERIWKTIVPDLASQNTFLWHGMLACSSLHMAHFNPDQRDEFTVRACSHQDQAIPLFRYAIQHPDADNCDAILAYSFLLIIYSFAAYRPEESLLLVNSVGEEELLPSWFHFIRGGCSMLCSVWDNITRGPARALADAWDLPIEIEDDDIPYLDHLLAVIPPQTAAHPWPDQVVQVYTNAATELSRSFACLETLGASSTTWDILRIWPMRVSMEYMSLLHDRHPGALILLAYYCILLKRMEIQWYFEGRAAKLMAAIILNLDEGWHWCIHEPLKRVGIHS